MTLSPPPWTRAPVFRKNACRSAISGSRAALIIRVTPGQAVAVRMVFSVAPTLGKLRMMSPPRRSRASHRISPPCSRMETPSFRREERCRSMGRWPISQPPGRLSRARPHRARIGPRKITEERISRMSSWGTSHRSTTEESTNMVSPSRLTLQPRCCRIWMAERTSRRSGQLCNRLRPPLRRVAAKMGRTLFFAPLMGTSPRRACPPRTR